MRFMCLLCLLPLLCGICIAQSQNNDQQNDTNFPVGPQYLVTAGSPMFLRPIATPSLNLGTAPAAVEGNTSEPLTGVEAASSSVTQSSSLLNIYYGAPAQTSSEVTGQVAGEVSGGTGEIEVSSAKIPTSLPASIVNVGVTEMLDPHSLGAREYGMDLAEVAAYWKSHQLHASRVYTNVDIARLHHG